MFPFVAVGSGGWSPLTPATPLAWFDASSGYVFTDTAGTTPAADTNSAARWNDRSGHGYSLIQATGANKPTYLTAGWNGLKPCLSFDGTNDLLKSTEGGFADYPTGTNREVTIFMTCKPTAGIDIDKFLVEWSGSVSGHFWGAYISESSEGNKLTIDAALGTTGAAALDASGFKRLALMAGGGTVTSYVDSVPHMVDEIFNNTVAALNTFSVGDNIVGSKLYAGLWAELVIYVAKLTPTDFANYRRYSAFKWGG